ncbi:MAG: hypothetical protein M3160_01075, partial [Candidatus Eremiobacteraeota bacterium]|nr:hypothetical protein [Candidatus Eremiobacteraeota bacterium]
APHGPVVVIVRRFLAVRQPEPSPDDIAALPYAHIESAAALRPFTVLQDSKAVLPGPRLSDRGLQGGNGLLLDEGVPNYDIVSGYSLFSSLPARYAQTVEATPATDAFRYGDQAGGGTFEINSANPQRVQNSLILGSDSSLRVTLPQRNAQAIAAASNDSSEARERAEIVADKELSDAQLHFVSATSLAHALGAGGDTFSNGYTFAGLSMQRTRDYRLSGTFGLDRGFYRGDFSGSGLTSTWADGAVEANAQSLGPVTRFAGFALRESSGYDESYNSGVPDVAAHLSQRHAYVGIHAGHRFLDETATLDGFQSAYSGGPAQFPSSQAGLFPGLRLNIKPNERWNLVFSAVDTFRLPTFLEKLSAPGLPGFYDRSRILQSSVSYTDLSRVRAELTNFSETTRGVGESTSWGIGASLMWQLTPSLSLRAWMLRFNSSRQYAGTSTRAMSFDVSSFWLTYEMKHEVRADFLFRRNLMDFEPDAHFDAAVSGPLHQGLRWRLSTERRHMLRYVDFGFTSIR